MNSDVVLDVERMRRRAARLSRHVTIAQVPGALHDVTLSPEPARSQVFDELQRFLTAYVDCHLALCLAPGPLASASWLPSPPSPSPASPPLRAPRTRSWCRPRSAPCPATGVRVRPGPDWAGQLGVASPASPRLVHQSS